MFLLKNPRFSWLIVIASLVYLISPFDVLPDFFPILGQGDDLILIAFLINSLIQNWPKFFSNSANQQTHEKTIDVDATPID